MPAVLIALMSIYASQALAMSNSPAVGQSIWVMDNLIFFMVLVIIGPCIYYSYAVSSKRKKIRVSGYYCLGAYFGVCASLIFFGMVFDAERSNFKGLVSVTFFTYGICWTCSRARLAKMGLDYRGFPQDDE